MKTQKEIRAEFDRINIETGKLFKTDPIPFDDIYRNLGRQDVLLWLLGAKTKIDETV